jgi:hypothetical protein
MSERYLWRVWCITEGQYVTTVQATAPTECPNDSGHSIDSTQTAIIDTLFTDIIEEGYINIESILADNQAVKIQASNAAGGIDIDSGSGGITIDSTNAISIDAGAASNLTCSVGNLELRATAALVNIDGGSGINIGSLTETAPINVGTPSSSRTITIGNLTTSSQVNILTGTGGFLVDTASGGGISLDATGASCNFTLASTGDAQDLTIALTGSNNSSIILSSAGTGTDAIILNTAGGIDADATGPINIATGSNIGGAITLDAAFNNGGITISSGSQGIAINSGTGLLGIGHWSAGNMEIGTSATDRTITVGNTTGATSIVLNSGTGGITIGNNANGGEVQIANTTNAKTLTIGNSTGASKTFFRWGTGGLIKSQPAPTSLSNTSQTVTIAALLTGILFMTPTTDRTVTLPTAANAVAGITGVAIGDCIDFSIINLGSNDNLIIVAVNTGGTLTGNGEVLTNENTLNTYKNGAGSIFRMRFTNVTASSEAYTVYRVC